MVKRLMKAGTMLNPVPVVMVSCGNIEEKSNIITIAWTGIVNSEPPMTYVSIRKSRYSHKMIRDSGEFVINLVNKKIVKATDYCGVKSGAKEDKFLTQNLTKIKGEFVKCPMIEEAPINLECIVKDVISYPSHDMFVAEIMGVNCDEELFDDNDKIRLDKINMVAYNHGEYFELKEKPLGFFGYSVMKPKTKKRKDKVSRVKYGK